MSRILLFASFFLSAIGYVGLANAQGEREGEYTITVQGVGVVPAAPDRVRIYFTISEQNPKMNAAIEAHSRKATATLDFIRHEGIPDSDIKTISYSFQPAYEYNQAQRRNELVGYRVNQSFFVEDSNLAGGALIEGIAVHAFIDSIVFAVSNEGALREKAIARAIEDAKQRAKLSASQVGFTLGDIIGFYESSPNQPVYERGNLSGSAMDTRAAMPQIPSGETEIRAIVTITYKLVTKG